MIELWVLSSSGPELSSCTLTSSLALSQASGARHCCVQRDSSLGDHRRGTEYLTPIWNLEVSRTFRSCMCAPTHMHAHVTLRRANGKLGCPETLSTLFFETGSLVGLGLADLPMLASPRTPEIFLVSASPKWANSHHAWRFSRVLHNYPTSSSPSDSLPRPQLVLLEGQHSERLGLQRNVLVF